MDGVNSMTGNAPDLPRVRRGRPRATARCSTSTTPTASASSASADPTRPSPYGARGNSVVRHAGETYDNLVLVGGFSKAYSSLLAFIACPTEVKDLLKVAAPPYLYSGPSPVASLATVLAGFDVNERRGDALRARRCTALTARVLDAPRPRSASHTPNRSGLPDHRDPAARPRRASTTVGRFLFDRGVYVTLAAYPLVPKDEVGFRVQLTAANTDAEVDRADRGARGARRPRRAAQRARSRRALEAACMSPARALGAAPPRLAASTSPSARCCARSTCAVPPFKGSGPLMNLLGLSPVRRDPRRRPPAPPASRGAVVLLRRRLRRCSGSATSTPTATRTCSARDVPFPSLGRRRSTCAVYPALMAGPAAARPAPQRRQRDRARRHRRADPHASASRCRRGSR